MRYVMVDEVAEEVVRAVVAALGPSPEMPDLQRHLFDSGVHGMVAWLVTEQVTGVASSEAYEAYISSPFRAAERERGQAVRELFRLMHETERRQERVCVERQVPRTRPLPNSTVGLARAVGAGLWPLNGLRRPIEGSTSGWHVWAGDGELDQAPDYFEPVPTVRLYDRCPEVLPYLGLPPGWRFRITPDHSDVWEDSALRAS